MVEGVSSARYTRDLPVMVWDQGTRDEGESESMHRAGELAKDQRGRHQRRHAGRGMPRNFLVAASEAVGHPLALEPELAPGSVKRC